MSARTDQAPPSTGSTEGRRTESVSPWKLRSGSLKPVSLFLNTPKARPRQRSAWTAPSRKAFRLQPSPLKVTGSGQWSAAPARALSIVARLSWAVNEMIVPWGQGAWPSTTAASSLPRKHSGVSATRQPGARSSRGPRAREEIVQPRFESA